MNSWEELKKRADALPDDVSGSKIEETAGDLEGMNYSPILLLDMPHFLRMGKADIQQEVARICLAGDEDLGGSGTLSSDEMRQKHLSLLLYHYELLCRLRSDDPTAWDEVNELYEDD